MVAPAGTVAVIVVAVDSVTVASVPLNLTVFSEGVVLKSVPVMVIDSPTFPVAGSIEVMVGITGCRTVNGIPLETLPFEVTTRSPVVAP